jgi:hypothetical protein
MRHLFGPPTARAVPQPAMLTTTPIVAPAAATSSVPDSRCVLAARAAANARQLAWGDEAAVERQVLAILAASQRRALTELGSHLLAADGSVAIDSMSAVFVYSIIFDILGSRAMPRLGSNSVPADFVSTRSLARLVHRLRRSESAA